MEAVIAYLISILGTLHTRQNIAMVVSMITILAIYDRVFIRRIENTALDKMKLIEHEAEKELKRMGDDMSSCKVDLTKRMDDKFILGINQVTNAVEKIEHMFKLYKDAFDRHVDDESKRYDKFDAKHDKIEDKLTKLMDSIENMNGILVQYSLSKTDVSNVVWETLELMIHDNARTVVNICYDLGSGKQDNILIFKEISEAMHDRKTNTYTKCVELGASEVFVNACRDVDSETYPSFTILLQEYIQLCRDNEPIAKNLKQEYTSIIATDWLNRLKRRVNIG